MARTAFVSQRASQGGVGLMAELVIARGWPGAGKSTWARQQAAQPGWARICRDDLRQMQLQADLDEKGECIAALACGLPAGHRGDHVRMPWQ